MRVRTSENHSPPGFFQPEIGKNVINCKINYSDDYMENNDEVDVRLFPERGIISKTIIASGILILILMTLAFAAAFFQSLLGLI